MKRCPTCQRTYTDDSLTFCLQDGALLLAVSDASASYDQGAQTEILNQPVAPTILSPGPDSVTVPQQRITNPSWSDIAPQSAAQGHQPPPRNRALMVGVISIAVLLLGLVGIGVALLLRNSSDGNRETASVDNKNGSANVNANANSNANVNVNKNANSNANVNASPAPKPTNSSPAVSNNSNGSQPPPPPPPDAASRVEAKILRDTPLTESDLAGLSSPVLRRLRNAVYARHGRTFNTPELQRYFDSRPWYRARSDYSDQDLSPTDRANISLIQAAEGGCQ